MAQDVFDLITLGRLQDLKDYVAAGGDIHQRRGNYNESALHYASRSKHVDIIRYLVLECKMSPSIEDKAGYTPLHEAVMGGRIEAVDTLLELGADRYKKNHNNKSSVDMASPGMPEILAALRGEPRGWVLTQAEEISHVSFKQTLKYKLTEIFNFGAGTYTAIAKNFETGHESMSVRTMGEMAETPIYKNAVTEFNKRGGKSEAAAVILDKPAPSGSSGLSLG